MVSLAKAEKSTFYFLFLVSMRLGDDPTERSRCADMGLSSNCCEKPRSFTRAGGPAAFLPQIVDMFPQ